MSYTLEVGEKAPNFESLLSTDGKFYSLSDINKRPFNSSIPNSASIRNFISEPKKQKYYIQLHVLFL